MRVAISGSSGFLGSALLESLVDDGHEVTRLVRNRDRAGVGRVYWDPDTRAADVAGLENHDVVVHLAGESMFGLWTAARRRRIWNSRVGGTAFLAETLAGLERPPRVLITTSASGYYGDRGSERVTEESAPGQGFLPELAQAWENAAAPAAAGGIRVATARLGIVLHPRGGALATMLPIFRAGLGGKLGDGRQIWAWISQRDLIRALRFLMDNEISGAVNVDTPDPVTNAEFTRTLARVLKRPAFFRAPGFPLALLLGDFGRQALLGGAHVYPERLLRAGFTFQDAALEPALRRMLDK